VDVVSGKPRDVVVELGGQRAGVELVEVDELNEIHELGRASVQRVVHDAVRLQLRHDTQRSTDAHRRSHNSAVRYYYK